MVCIPRSMTAARCSVSRRSPTRPHTTRLRSQNSLTLPHSLTLSPVRYFTATTYASAKTFVDARGAPGSSPWPRRVQRSSVFEIPSRPDGSPRKKKTNGLIHRHSLDLRLISFRSTMGYAIGGLRYDVGLCRFDELYDIHNITSPLMTHPGPNLYMLTKDEQRKARP